MAKLGPLTTTIAVLVNAGKARKKQPMYEVLPSRRAKTAVHRDWFRILFPKECAGALIQWSVFRSFRSVIRWILLQSGFDRLLNWKWICPKGTPQIRILIRIFPKERTLLHVGIRFPLIVYRQIFFFTITASLEYARYFRVVILNPWNTI